MQNHVYYNKNLSSQSYTKLCISYVGLFGCMQFAGKTEIHCWIEAMITSTSLKLIIIILHSFTPHEEATHLKVVPFP